MTASVKQEPCGKNSSSSEPPVPVSTSKRTKSYESRKIRKPLMEKKRRMRINQSLNELKRILLEANGAPTKKEGNQRPAKLEKADILELTLKYVQSLHTNHDNNDLSQSNNNNNSSNKSSSSATTMINVTSTSVSDTDDETTSSSTQTAQTLMTTTTDLQSSDALSSSTLKIDTINLNNSNNIETSFIHGFAECIRLVENSMKNLKSSQLPRALENKLKNHLAELHQISMNKSPEMRHHDCGRVLQDSNAMMLDDPDTGDEHDMMTYKNLDSPASISQMSPPLISNKSNNFNNNNPCEQGININSNNRSAAVLIPTRMSNGELAFVLKCSDNNGILSTRGVQHHGGGFDIDIPFDNHNMYSYTRMIRGERNNYSGFTDNHMDNHRVIWRPW